MKTEHNVNEELIRWLEGDLSGEELSAFEASAEFKDYKRILDASDKMAIPTMDAKEVFLSIQNKISNKKSKSTSAKIITLRKWFVAIASIAILSFAVISLLPKSIQVTSDVGEFVSHTLPDGSEVNINGNSKINYSKNFQKLRILELAGEAFFNVKKGESFVVETDAGTVSVLGTSFNVFSRNKIFTVACKSGKVKVDSDQQSIILQKGEIIKIENKVSVGKEIIEPTKIGSWIKGESYFSNAQLQQVVLAISSAYDVTINLPSDYNKKRFTGSFVHNDLNKALKMVFSPMGILYSVNDKGEVHITSE